MSVNAARRLVSILLGLLVVVGAGSPAVAAPATAVPAAAPAAVGGIDLPCVLPAGMCKDIKETGKKAIDKTLDGAKWACDKAKKVCEVAVDTAVDVAENVDGAVDAVGDTIDFATDPLGYLAKKSSPAVGKLVEAIATDGM
jgi:hypothetical protein